jgi:hypothetical protein
MRLEIEVEKVVIYQDEVELAKNWAKTRHEKVK